MRLELAIALPIALFLNLSFRGRGFVRAAVMVPYIIAARRRRRCCSSTCSTAISASLNDLLVRLGVLDRYVSWLSDPTGELLGHRRRHGLVRHAADGADPARRAADDPAELYEAARSTAPARWQRFRYITLPHLMPTILFLVLLRTIWMSNHIDMIFVMTRGGPGFANYTEAVYSFMLTNQFRDRLCVGGRRGAGDHPDGGLGALCAPPRAHGAGVDMTHASAPTARRRSIAVGADRDPRLFARRRSLWIVHRLDHARAEGRRSKPLDRAAATIDLFPEPSRRFENYVDLFAQRAVRALFPQLRRSSRPATCC